MWTCAQDRFIVDDEDAPGNPCELRAWLTESTASISPESFVEAAALDRVLFHRSVTPFFTP
jgi:hypothetical protein